MEQLQYHHHHHHHHGQSSGDENQGQQNATISEGLVTSVVGENQQRNLSVPFAQQTVGGIQTTGSFHSVSSIDSSAEMAKYFPDAQTPNLSPYRHQQEVEGQLQSTATSNTVVTSNINTVNAGPYIPVSAPTAVQSQPVRAPFMAQQQPQRPVRPPGQQPPTGIPSYSSQIEGLSVSQAVVNDVLVDLQSKVINEALQQYQDEASNATFLEPLPPIYIRAPQPTVILQSDLHRLRAELNSRVRPPAVYRHPGSANQFQQRQFQQNIYQAPRFPAPPQQYIPPGYGDYQNAAFTTSDEYKTTPTTDDEHRKEREERLYNQAESPMLNDDNINDNVQNAFDLQGLSTASFDRHASPYEYSSFLPNLGDQQQGNEETVLASSHHINDEEVGRTDNMYSRPGHPRQEVSFDINNCIYRCFEAHRQRVARRRAARQARRARRHKQSGQQPYQQYYQTDQYQNLPTQWNQQKPPPPSSAHYSDGIHGLTDSSTSQGPYIPAQTYDYTNVVQTGSLPADIQQYQSSDIITSHTSQIPFSALSTSNIDGIVPNDAESSNANYYQYKTVDTQGPYISPNTFDYASQQAVSSNTDFIQQPFIEQQQQQQQVQTSSDYAQQFQYTAYPSSTDAIVPNDIQNLTSEYYQQHQQQQQQIPTQFTQSQATYDYAAESTQTQIPSYDYQNIAQQSYQYPYNVDNIQTEQKQTFDYANQAVSSADYYQQQQQQQPVHVPVSQAQGTFSKPTGTVEYTRESYQSQEPIYNYQSTDQQSSQYSYNVEDVQQITQQDSYNYVPSTHIDTNLIGQNQSFDYTSQGINSTNYYQQQHQQQQPTTQIPENYTQSAGTYNYTTDTAQAQIPTYDYQNIQQQSYQYPYNIENIAQQSYDYTSNASTTAAYVPPESTIQQTTQNQTFDSSNYYQQQPIPTFTTQGQGAYGQPTGTFEYTQESYQSQEPIYNYQGADQQTSQYSYNIESIQPQQQDVYNYASQGAATYSTSEANIQHLEQNQTYDYQQQQPITIPVTQTDNAQLFNQRNIGASVPTGTVEYTRQAYYSQEPISDSYTTETFIQQQEENQSLNVNDYLNRFESGSSSISTGGQIKSSDDLQSFNTISTTPFIIQQNVNIQPSQGAAQTYDLQNYTNESLVSETSPAPVLSSSIYEEDHQYLLQQPEQHSDKEISLNDTYSSLPPPPLPTKKEIDHQHESIGTSSSEFPPPPPTTLDSHTYQITSQRPSRLHTSIIPSTEQQILKPPSPSSSDRGTDEDSKEDEEIFDLRKCIENCYAKYQDQWNKEEQRKYQEQLQGTQQTVTDVNTQQFSQYQQTTTNIPRSYSGTGEIHYIDGWTQTPSLDVITQSNIIQHKYDETPATFDMKPYIPHLPTRDLSTDSRGQQTIEYSPPLITQTRHTIPTIPSSVPLSSYEYEQQQQQQPIYDHSLPVPPHLSFNDTDYQTNLYFSSQITAQPRQNENIPLDINEQQQRYRAHSEPASIKQDSIASIPPIQTATSQVFEEQTGRSISTPTMRYQQSHPQLPSVRLIDGGRAYETEAVFQRRVPQIDPKTGLCLVPCPQAQKYAHLPPHLRPELFCVELPPPSSLPPVPPPPPPQSVQQRWCVRCCCVPGQTLVKKVVYRQAEDEQQHQEESQYDYASVIDQMATTINVRYGNSIMEEGDAFVSGNYNEKLRVIDFPVYVSGKNDPNLTPLVPVN